MRSITTWYRIEPRSDDPVPGPDRGLQARIFDPAWLLGRQWQLGELTGDDAASPAWVRVRAAASRLDQLEVGGTPIPIDSHRDLEPLVETEPTELADPGEAWAASVAAGQHWLATLRTGGLETLVDDFRGAFPVPDPDPSGSDAEAAARWRLLRRTALDGRSLLAAATGADGVVRLPPQPVVPQGLRHDAEAALRAWAAWYLEPISAGDAWVDDRLEYRFSVTAADPMGGGTTVLDATAYQGGHLDWHDFDAGAERPTDGRPVRHWAHHGLPTRVGYPGMPANRWWELEDGAVSYPSVESDAGDLARMLLIEFATVYGNDWFVAPVDIRFGTLLAIEGVVVIDTFGREMLVSAAEAPGWSMFRTSGGPANRIVLPSVVSGSAEGAPVEEVLLIRDEMANMAWAIERTVSGAAGQRVDRHERWRDRLAGEPEQSVGGLPDDTMVYSLADEPPDHWTPLVPVADGPRSIRLRRGIFLHGDAATFPPLGRFLEPSRPFILFEEEVPRSGITLARVWQVSRASDGRLVAWLGRRAQPGRGEGRSQIAFDRLGPGTQDSTS
jgi:hypothetical protein